MQLFYLIQLFPLRQPALRALASAAPTPNFTRCSKRLRMICYRKQLTYVHCEVVVKYIVLIHCLEITDEQYPARSVTRQSNHRH